MKVASSTTITASDATGLPSLRSSQADLLLPADGLPVAAPKDSASDPAAQSFDAVLAMLSIPLNLPLPPVTSPTPVVTNEVVSPAPPVVLNLTAQMPMTAAITTGAESAKGAEDFFKSSSEPSTTKLETPDMKMTPLPLASVEAKGDSAVADKNLQRVLDQQKAPATPVVEPIETPRIEPVPPATLVDSTKSASIPPVDRPVGKVGDADLDQTATELKSESTSLANIELPPTVESSKDVLSQWAAQPETIESSQRKPDVLPDVSGQKEIRHRPAMTEGRLTVEGTTPQSRISEPTANAPLPMNSESLANSLAAAVQSHRNELVAGRPIELQLRLDPPGLGMVRVHLRLTDDAVSVRFIAGDEAVTRLLESQLPDLRQSLAERGLAFTQCNVTCGGGQQQAFDFQQQSADRTVFAPSRLVSRTWSSASPVQRSSIARGDRLDVLA